MTKKIKSVTLALSIEVDRFSTDMPTRFISTLKQNLGRGIEVRFETHPNLFVIENIPATSFSFVYGLVIQLAAVEVNELKGITVEQMT